MENEPGTILRQIIADRPPVHPNRSGEERCIGLQGEALLTLFDLLKPGMTTLETGCGLSTLTFALARCQHQAIVPNPHHIRETAVAAEKYDILMDTVSFVEARSEFALPTLQPLAPLAVVLIDGGHAFPIPFIDWFYSSHHMDVGAICVLDDIHLKTVSILQSFLEQQPNWELVTTVQKSSFFRKLDADSEADMWDYWHKQPFNQTLHSRLSRLIKRWR